MKTLGLTMLLLFLTGSIFYIGLGHKCQAGVATIYRIKTDIHVIAHAVELYKSETGALPNSLNDLVGAYFKILQTDPWGMDYHYETQQGEEFKVFTLGYDFEVGGTGLATDMSRKTDFDSLIKYIRAPICGCNV